MHRIWQRFWTWAGRVPLRQKIIGIVVSTLVIHGCAIGFWVRAGLGGWLSYLLEEERVQQAMAAGTRGVFIITVLAALAGLVFAWMLTWVLTRPILAITKVAQRAEGGDLSPRAPVWANDEIGQLGLAFNAMIESMARARKALEDSNLELRRRNQELALLYELAGLACRPTNLQRLLEEALDRLLRITPAKGACIAQEPHDGKGWQILARRHLDEAEIRQLLQDRIEATDLAISPTPQENAQDIEDPPVILAPIQAQDGAQGWLLLLGSRPDAFRQADRTLAEAVRSALSVAMQNARLWEELKAKETSRASLLAKVVTAQEDERQRISRELHDETGQALTTLLVQLKLLEGMADLERIRQRAAELRQLTAHALEEVRRLALDLRPAALDDLGLVAAIEGFITEHARAEALTVHFDAHAFGEERLPRDMETVLYRIIQEAVTNILRHAQAREAWVELARDAEGIHLRVRDDGLGFDPQQALGAQPQGMGLLGMQERAELLGGTFGLTSAPGQGTQIEITAPLTGETLHG